ncbi:putative proteasome component [Actinomyces johnsonii F0542]|uniref:Putative proteasome component n=1 Tax=Actinomyces johnsonii F0542 TaxID=1321818 RepID=U1RLI2_9ACTO|nr:proteasome accessory factor PafA2 family protein [Actinomyces johnsonii]ERH20488.1 putative proteasome component [Actinomyces johnsonii F0542]
MSTSGPGPRVTGLETEFGVLCAPAGPQAAAKGDLPDVERAAALIFRHRPAGYRSTNLFLPNGGRLYLDIGDHPEYATAECVRVRDLIAQDQAGREILAAMAQRAAASLAQRGTPARLHLLANNTDSAGHTYGCHESYSVPRHLLDDAPGVQGVDGGSGEAVMAVLTSFLATRPVLVGSGRPLGAGAANGDMDGSGAGDEEAAWGLSPRAPHLKTLTSADTTGQRALVNTRDEPHADAARLRRLHVTCADTTMAEPTTGLRSAVTLLLLDALEAGWDFTDLSLTDPLATLSALGESPWGDVSAVTIDGRRLTAVDIQEAFLERLASYLDDAGVPDFLRGAEHLLEDLAPRVISALRHHDAGSIDTEIDWAIKRRLMRAQRERHPRLSGEALEVLRSRVDLAYHDLNAETGLAPRLTAQGAMALLCEPEEIERAHHAPPTTRAALRGAFVAACLEVGADFSVTWESLRLDSPPTAPVDLSDPLAAVHEAAEALTERVKHLRPEEMHRIDLVGRGGLGAPG